MLFYFIILDFNSARVLYLFRFIYNVVHKIYKLSAKYLHIG